MLIYNTTYTVDSDQESAFLAWIHDFYIPEIINSGVLKFPKLLRVLSHNEQGICYSLQFSVANSLELHHWYISQGSALAEEMKRIFGNKVIGFPTLMEEIN